MIDRSQGCATPGTSSVHSTTDGNQCCHSSTPNGDKASHCETQIYAFGYVGFDTAAAAVQSNVFLRIAVVHGTSFWKPGVAGFFAGSRTQTTDKGKHIALHACLFLLAALQSSQVLASTA